VWSVTRVDDKFWWGPTTHRKGCESNQKEGGVHNTGLNTTRFDPDAFRSDAKLFRYGIEPDQVDLESKWNG
jgi:hypothetical protein